MFEIRRMAVLCALVALTGFGVPPALAETALTLDDCFAAAMARSETIGTQAELIAQAEERYSQAGAALWPTVSGIATRTWTDTGARDTTANPTRQTNARLTATQPLFRGFREFAAIRQSRSLVSAQSADFRNARTQLFRDVAQNFFDVLAIERDLANYDEQIRLYAQRENELQQRVRIGRSRPAEVLTVQTTISTLHAQVELLRAQLGTAREAFAFLTGLPENTPLRDTEDLPADTGTLDDYLKRVGERSDVRAAHERLVAAQENVSVARGAHYPSLDLNANRYFERTGSLEDVEWDVQLALTVPIWSGGATQSKVREALSQSTQAELGESRTRRSAEQEIRSAWQAVNYGRTRLKALEKATVASKQNYEAQRADYRLGLVTNLDVLSALTTYQENRRALDRARFTAKLDFLRLLAAADRRPVPSDGGLP